jgi:NAD(P)H-hydrate repair Nnr-like enzyme with NAD(P)H-hydrate dehydratase domain
VHFSKAAISSSSELLESVVVNASALLSEFGHPFVVVLKKSLEIHSTIINPPSHSWCCIGGVGVILYTTLAAGLSMGLPLDTAAAGILVWYD